MPHPVLRSPSGRSFRPFRIALVALALVGLGACGGVSPSEKGSPMASVQSVPDSSWATLASKRVFFGHQSVGANIVQGIGDVLRDHPNIGLRVVDGDSAADGGPAFAQALVGKNGDPAGKSDDFAARLEGGVGRHVDIAFHKYCYVDMPADADPKAVFAHYKATMDRLHAEFPNVTFVHVTTPLVTVPGDPRALIKRLLGQAPLRLRANLVREQFNDLMRREYGGREPLFDLSLIESTRPDGARETVSFGNRFGYALVPAYASDGAHLNEAGRRRAAESLLVFLAELSAGAGASAPAR